MLTAWACQSSALDRQERRAGDVPPLPLELVGPVVLRATNDGQTHAEGCHAWGPRHYECALGHIKCLEGTISLIDGLEKGRG